jgi:hypothetical protein
MKDRNAPTQTAWCAPGGVDEVRPDYRPAFDMPTTAAEALAWLTQQGDPTCMTFSPAKAKRAAELLGVALQQTETDPVTAAALAELNRAVQKFPTWPTDPLHAVAVLGEEFGELTKAVLQSVYEPHKVKPGDVQTETVQVAAMALRFLRSLHSYEFTPGAQHEQPALSQQPAAPSGTRNFREILAEREAQSPGVTAKIEERTAELVAATSGEPVAFVPVHPRMGPLWSDTYPAGSAADGRSPNYEHRPLFYAAPQQPEAPSEVERLKRHAERQHAAYWRANRRADRLAEEVERLKSDLSDYMQAANYQATRAERLAAALRLAEEHLTAITPEWYSAGQRVLAETRAALRPTAAQEAGRG